MSKVYRGDILIWTNAPASATKWLTSGLNRSFDETVTTDYVTNGINKNLK
ncbi:MAG: hypothetical protein ACO295_03555 [Sediminibacterium sp.]